jgi:hypothetical protein
VIVDLKLIMTIPCLIFYEVNPTSNCPQDIVQTLLKGIQGIHSLSSTSNLAWVLILILHVPPDI